MPVNIEIPGYTILRRIGAGGMAHVYLARQDLLDRTVAIKVLKETLSSQGDEFKQRFEHEGRILARLEQENIVKIHDIGSTDHSVYLVMEYLSGGTLTERIKKRELPVAETLEICSKIALALHAAHVQNIIHRDLKPSNIMFRDPATPVLTDFGIARQIDLDLTLTETGMMIGTPQYMSPEQIRGLAVDPRSDIYSLGLMLYRLLTGDVPFRATDPIAIAVQQIQDPPPPLPPPIDVLQPVLDRMLAKKPEDRYQGALDFCTHLEEVRSKHLGDDHEWITPTRVYPVPLRDSAAHSGTQPGASASADEKPSLARRLLVTVNKRRSMAAFAVAALVLTAGILFRSLYFSHDLNDEELAIIDRELRRFSAYLDTEQIIEPPGRNATETLQTLLEIAPDYGDVLDASETLADRYELLAYNDLDAGRLDKALEWSSRGTRFAPEHEGLLRLRELAQTQRDERDRLQRIDDLLTRGNAALAQGNLLPPAENNAFEAFRAVRALDAQNEAAESGLSDIQQLVSAQVSVAWQAGNRQQAMDLLEAGLTHFADSTLLLDTRSTLQQQVQQEREQERLDSLLVAARQHIDQSRFVSPPGDNAMEALSQARQIDPSNADVQILLESLAVHFRTEAEASLRNGRFRDSIEAAAHGLDAMPGDPVLVSVQEEATSRLGEFERRIQVLINRAEAQVLAGQYIPGQPGLGPEGENAFDTYTTVLEIDRGQRQAINGLARLPDVIDTTVARYERQRDWQQARALLLAAQSHYGESAAYEDRISSLGEALAAEAARRELETDLAEINDMIAAGPATQQELDQIAARLRSASAAFPDEVEVAESLSRFIATIEHEAEQASLAGADSDALRMIEHALSLYPSNENLEQAKSAIVLRDSQRREQERLDRLARSGTLSIDASPWARVLQVRDIDGRPIAIPEDSETPLHLTLLEGEYTVVLQSSEGRQLQEITARVERQKTISARPAEAGLTADTYFQKSGW